MKALTRTLLPFAFCLGSIGSAVAQSDAAKAADKSEKAAEKSEKAAEKSEKAAEKAAQAAAKFDLPTNITLGDRIKLRSNISGLAPANGGSAGNASVGTCLRVNRLGANGGITVSVEEGRGLLSGTCQPPSGTSPVQVGDSYTITADQLKNASYSRYGWVYGPMVVPFKYFPHDRSFEPSQSLGMYTGYRTSWFEARGMSFVGSAGLATMKVSEVVDDPAKPGSKTTKENTIAGYTIAAGVLFDLTREAEPFVAGLLIGRDFVGRNSALTYKHDNRTWIALQLGWAQ